MAKTRFVLIGGFLGAGKTTLLGQLAQQYVAEGKRVGIITNDQAADLVDTQNLRSQGFDVGEVSGACFCCSFSELVDTAGSLSAVEPPDVLLAEPVGSCTDLVATVVLPLQQLFGERFELAPFGVLLKPSHGRRILAAGSGGTRSGFSPQAEYIFRKQLEEADYVMIGRQDQLSNEEIASLCAALAEATGEADVPVLAVSPKSGYGLERVREIIDSPQRAGRRLLEIDYDTYADGEAELGWVNLAARLASDAPIDLDQLAATIVGRIAHEITGGHEIPGGHGGHIAHLKTSVLGGDAQAVANVVSNDSGVDVGLTAGRSVAGAIEVIVNARVAIDPEVLRRLCEDQVEAIAGEVGATLSDVSAHALRPGRPTPTHRVTA